MAAKSDESIDCIPMAWLKSVPAPLFLLDDEGRIIWCNEAFVELGGYSREGLIGARLDRLFGQNEISKMVQDIIELYTGQPFASHPYDLMRESGNAIHVTMDLTPIFHGGAKTVTHVFGNIRSHYGLS